MKKRGQNYLCARGKKWDKTRGRGYSTMCGRWRPAPRVTLQGEDATCPACIDAAAADTIARLQPKTWRFDLGAGMPPGFIIVEETCKGPVQKPTKVETAAEFMRLFGVVE